MVKRTTLRQSSSLLVYLFQKLKIPCIKFSRCRRKYKLFHLFYLSLNISANPVLIAFTDSGTFNLYIQYICIKSIHMYKNNYNFSWNICILIYRDGIVFSYHFILLSVNSNSFFLSWNWSLHSFKFQFNLPYLILHPKIYIVYSCSIPLHFCLRSIPIQAI